MHIFVLEGDGIWTYCITCQVILVPGPPLSYTPLHRCGIHIILKNVMSDSVTFFMIFKLMKAERHFKMSQWWNPIQLTVS